VAFIACSLHLCGVACVISVWGEAILCALFSHSFRVLFRPLFSIVRAFLTEEQKIVKRVMKAQSHQ
jgi:predicted Co/Zn/Cd cation transporter (cation efflux family)